MSTLTDYFIGYIENSSVSSSPEYTEIMNGQELSGYDYPQMYSELMRRKENYPKRFDSSKDTYNEKLRTQGYNYNFYVGDGIIIVPKLRKISCFITSKSTDNIKLVNLPPKKGTLVITMNPRDTTGKYSELSYFRITTGMNKELDIASMSSESPTYVKGLLGYDVNLTETYPFEINASSTYQRDNGRLYAKEIIRGADIFGNKHANFGWRGNNSNSTITLTIENIPNVKHFEFHPSIPYNLSTDFCNACYVKVTFDDNILIDEYFNGIPAWATVSYDANDDFTEFTRTIL